MKLLHAFTVLASVSCIHATQTTEPWREDLLELHKNLVDIESLSGNELEVGNWLETFLIDNGFSVEKQRVSNSSERYNIYAWGGTVEEKGKEQVLLTSHTDTVPPHIPYSRVNDTIYGRGTVDAKGSIATQIIGALSFLEDNPSIPRSSIGLLYVVGEEVDAAGMRFFSNSTLNKQNYKAVIFGEPTEQKLVSGHKGSSKVIIHVQGRAAHSGYPWLGLSAIDILVRGLTAIKVLEPQLPTSPRFGNTTINAGVIAGGAAANIVAASARAELVLRLAASTPLEALNRIKEALASEIEYATTNGGNVTFEGGASGSPPVALDTDIKEFDEFPVVNYGTDIPNLKVANGTKRYLYGPGSIQVAHRPDEQLRVADLVTAVKDYKKILKGVLNGEQNETYRKRW